MSAETAQLTPSKAQKAEQERSLDASTTHEVIRRMGEDELRRTTSALAWSGLAAGMSMGFSLVAEGLLRAHLPDASWRPLVVKFGYSAGFLIVILGSQQLFTENTLTPIVPLLTRRSAHMLRQVLRLWGIVLVTNLVGALLFALVMARTDAVAPATRAAFDDIARETLRFDFWTTALHAVFAGWLIALLVWMLPAAKSLHVVTIILMTYLVGLGGFAHVVAGSVEVFYAASRGLVGYGEGIGRFIVPTLLGNMLGGVSLVAALNHAQVVAGGGER